jgi:hypothetical protein
MINSSESYDIANQWTLRSVIRPNAKDNIIWGAEEAAPEVVAAPSTETPEA